MFVFYHFSARKSKREKNQTDGNRGFSVSSLAPGKRAPEGRIEATAEALNCERESP